MNAVALAGQASRPAALWPADPAPPVDELYSPDAVAARTVAVEAENNVEAVVRVLQGTATPVPAGEVAVLAELLIEASDTALATLSGLGWATRAGGWMLTDAGVQGCLAKFGPLPAPPPAPWRRADLGTYSAAVPSGQRRADR